MKSLSIKTSDGHTFNVDWEVATQSQTIQKMLDYSAIDEDDNEVTIGFGKDITGPLLKKAMEWCEKNRGKPYIKTDDKESDELTKNHEFASYDQLKDWEKDFIKMPVSAIFSLIVTANILEIEGLKKLMVKAVGHYTGAVPKAPNQFYKAKKVRDAKCAACTIRKMYRRRTDKVRHLGSIPTFLLSLEFRINK